MNSARIVMGSGRRRREVVRPWRQAWTAVSVFRLAFPERVVLEVAVGAFCLVDEAANFFNAA